MFETTRNDKHWSKHIKPTTNHQSIGRPQGWGHVSSELLPSHWVPLLVLAKFTCVMFVGGIINNSIACQLYIYIMYIYLYHVSRRNGFKPSRCVLKLLLHTIIDYSNIIYIYTYTIHQLVFHGFQCVLTINKWIAALASHRSRGSRAVKVYQ